MASERLRRVGAARGIYGWLYIASVTTEYSERRE
jgi:hypothetical protein